jgi:LysM repeat protein
VNPPSSQAVPTAIRSNLRQLTSAARQYQLERGVSTVAYTDLVGPDKLIKELKPVAGENYSTLSFGPNVTAVNVTTANGATVSFDVQPATATAAAHSTVPPQSLPASTTNTPFSTSTPPESLVPTSTPPTPSRPADAASEVLPPTGRQPASPSYTIQGGDTWQKISEATGVPVLQLRQLNPSILEGSPLPAGQTIRVR